MPVELPFCDIRGGVSGPGVEDIILGYYIQALGLLSEPGVKIRTKTSGTSMQDYVCDRRGRRSFQ